MDRSNNFQPAVYIMANHKRGTIYVGVTSALAKRAWQHRDGQVDGFTKRYGCKRLVWFELHATMEMAIAREKQDFPGDQGLVKVCRSVSGKAFGEIKATHLGPNLQRQMCYAEM